MKRNYFHFSAIAFIISAIALTVGMLNLCIDEITGASIIIAALTLLVTVLIGFQIYNIVDLDRRFEKESKIVNKQIDSITNQVNERLESLPFSSAGLTLCEIGTAECIKGERRIAAKLLLNALMYMEEDKENYGLPVIVNSRRMAIGHLNLLITDSQANKQNISFPVDDNTRALYIRAILRVDSAEDKESILAYIHSLPRM